MSSPPQVDYAFGKFRLLPTDKQLLHDGTPVPLPPKVFETLCLLVEGRGRLVEKKEFLQRVWLGKLCGGSGAGARDLSPAQGSE